MTIDPSAPPPSSRLRPMPVFGCFMLIVLGAIAGALAVGGSFWGWVGVATLLLIAGVAVIIYFGRKNTRLPPSG